MKFIAFVWQSLISLFVVSIPSTYAECLGAADDSRYKPDFCIYQISNKNSQPKFELCRQTGGEINKPTKSISDHELLCDNSYINPALVIPKDFEECTQYHRAEFYDNKNTCRIQTGPGYAKNNIPEQVELGIKLLEECKKLESPELTQKDIYGTWCQITFTK